MNCTFGEIRLAKLFGLPGLMRSNDAVGTGIIGTSGQWTCPRFTWYMMRLHFFRPRFSVDIRVPGRKKPFVFQRGVLYLIVIAGKAGRSCIYRFSSRFPSEAAENAPNAETAGPPTSAPNTKQGDESSVWVWLGPVLGSVATVGAAILTVFKCTRRDAAQSATAMP